MLPGVDMFLCFCLVPGGRGVQIGASRLPGEYRKGDTMELMRGRQGQGRAENSASYSIFCCFESTQNQNSVVEGRGMRKKIISSALSPALGITISLLVNKFYKFYAIWNVMILIQ